MSSFSTGPWWCGALSFKSVGEVQNIVNLNIKVELAKYYQESVCHKNPYC